MKKKITQILAIAMVISASAFAGKNGGIVNDDIQASLTEKFTEAKEVNWTSTEQYVKASFKMNGLYMSAYFSKAGDLIGTSRHLVSSQLPLNLQKDLKKNLAGGWITELFEYATDDNSTYYATIENGDQKVFIKSIDNHSWELTKKVKKS